LGQRVDSGPCDIDSTLLSAAREIIPQFRLVWHNYKLHKQIVIPPKIRILICSQPVVGDKTAGVAWPRDYAYAKWTAEQA
jgi:hypothetical protein